MPLFNTPVRLLATRNCFVQRVHARERERERWGGGGGGGGEEDAHVQCECVCARACAGACVCTFLGVFFFFFFFFFCKPQFAIGTMITVLRRNHSDPVSKAATGHTQMSAMTSRDQSYAPSKRTGVIKILTTRTEEE